MIDRYSVAGYRSFYGRADVELAPLTLVYGRNSSGKSALVRALPLLHASMSFRGPQPLDLGAPVVRGTPYAELASLDSDERLMSWWVAAGQFELEVSIRDLAPSAGQVVDVLRYRSADREGSIRWTLQDDVYEVVEDDQRRSLKLRFNGLTPKDVALDGIDAGIAPIVDTTIEWLCAKREASGESAEPYTLTAGEHRGRNARVRLALDRRKGSRLLAWVDRCLRRVTDHRLEITETGPGVEAFVLRTGKGDRGPLVRLANTGEGVAHVLSVLEALGRAVVEPGDRVHVIEQPELHLHPRAEAELGMVMAGAAEGTATDRFLIETHSDNLLLGVQLAIAEGRLDPKRVRLCLVDQDEKGRSTVELGRFDADGAIDVGVRRPFEEGTELARRLVATRLTRQSGAKGGAERAGSK